jgi:hypothetical protein
MWPPKQELKWCSHKLKKAGRQQKLQEIRNRVYPKTFRPGNSINILILAQWNCICLFFNLFILFLLWCCGYIVTFTKVLTMYQIYHTAFTTSIILLYSLLPHSWNSFNNVSLFHLHACTHSICTIFTLLHPFPTSFLVPLIPTSQTGPVLHSCSPIL